MFSYCSSLKHHGSLSRRSGSKIHHKTAFPGEYLMLLKPIVSVDSVVTWLLERRQK